MTVKKVRLTIALVAFLASAAPIPAHANIIASEPTADALLITMNASLDLINGWLYSIWYLLYNGLDGISSTTSKATALTGAAQTQTLTTAIQGLNANATQNVVATAMTTITADGSPARTAVGCATEKMGGEVAQAATAAQAVTDNMVYMASTAGAGANADTSSPAYIQSEITDLCQLGFLGTFRYGALIAKLGCPTNDKYLDADIKLSSLLDHLQYPLPSKDGVHVTQDGHLVFSDINSANNNGTLSPNSGSGAVSSTETPSGSGLGSELDFVAAYKFCEHLKSPLSTPSHNSGTISVADMVSIKADRDSLAMRTAPDTECMHALAYRTACPSGTSGGISGTAGGSALTCHDLQYAVCQRLTASFADGGLNLSMLSSNPLYSQALANCQALGLSQAMADAIVAHKCQDDNFIANLPVVLGGKSADVEKVISFECPKLEAAYDEKMLNERILFETALQNMMIGRSLGSGSSGSRSVKP